MHAPPIVGGQGAVGYPPAAGNEVRSTFLRALGAAVRGKEEDRNHQRVLNDRRTLVAAGLLRACLRPQKLFYTNKLPHFFLFLFLTT